MRKLPRFALGLGAGCALGLYLHPGIGAALLSAGLLLLSVVLLLRRRESRALRTAVCLLLGLTLGLGWSRAYGQLFLRPAYAADGTTVSIPVTLSDYAAPTAYGSAAEGRIRLEGKSYRILLYFPDEAPDLAPGDRITGSIRLRLTAEGGAREPTYHRSGGIFLLGYVQKGYAALRGAPSLRDLPAQWRRAIRGALYAAADEQTAGFLAALLLGDKSGLSYAQRNTLSVAGLSHVVAVSGLHVSILFSLLLLLTGNRRWLRILLGLPTLVLFAALAGFSPSVSRACMMEGLLLLALAFEKEYDPPSALAFAAVVLLGLNPMVIGSISFQLSFGAVAGIFLVSGRIYRALSGTPGKRGLLPRLRRFLAGSFSVSAGAALFTTPLVAYYFGLVSILGFAVNVLCLWAVSLAFYAGALTCLAALLFAPAGRICGALAAWPVRYILTLAGGAAKLPHCALYTESLYTWLFLLGAYGLLGLFCLQPKRRPRQLVSCLLGLLLVCEALAWAEPKWDKMRVTALDVGQGQSILLEAQGARYLVDCGGSYADQAGETAARLLLSQGVTRLDGIVVTHYDADHCAGLPQLLGRIRCDRLYLPEVPDESGLRAELEGLGVPVRYVSRDLVLGDSRFTLSLFAPVSQEVGNKSCVSVLFTAAECDTLITGDLGQAEELKLLATHNLPELEILIVGHHGSAGSTSPWLLARLHPQAAILSVGESNPYGHPSAEVLDRLAQAGCAILRTDRLGSILIRR